MIRDKMMIDWVYKEYVVLSRDHVGLAVMARNRWG
jgi:hypothetical protein